MPFWLLVLPSSRQPRPNCGAMAKYRFKLTDVEGISRTVELEALESAPVPPALSLASQPESQPVSSAGCMFGAHVGGSGAAEVTWGRKIGKKVILIREYHQWQLPSSTTLDYLKTGHVVMASHKPPGGGASGWKTVRDGLADEILNQLADVYAPYAGRVIFVFHHEPHDDAPTRGSEFVGAYRRVANVMRARGISVGYCGTTSRVLKADPFYPGNEWVDVECHDTYNWYKYQGDREWATPEQRLTPLVALAKKRGHPLILGEINSHPGDAIYPRRSWYVQLVEFALVNPTLMGFCLYDSKHVHDWRATPDELSVFKDPYILSTPLPLPCGPVLFPRKTPDPDREDTTL